MSESFSMRGAVDLGALARRSASPAPGAAGPVGAAATRGSGSGVVRDVTTATFESDVIELSMTVPVIIDLWATWCEPCKSLSPILEQLAVADGGRWLLAKIDVDAEQQIAAAFKVQSIPSVFAVIKGQPLPLFQGALPAPQVRRFIDEVLRVATEQGLVGTVPGAVAPNESQDVEVEVEPPLDPRLVVAFDAIEAGDWDAASQAYRELLAASPADQLAKAGLAQVELLRRTDGRDSAVDVTAADADPDDVAAGLLAADAELINGDAVAAFNRLIALVRLTAGPERNLLRLRLLELFEIMGESPEVARARTALASALF